MRDTVEELPKYKYSYSCPIHLLNKILNSASQITLSNLQMDIPMIVLHDWMEMDDIVKLRQGDTFTHIWNNPSLLRRPLTNIYVQDQYTVMEAIMAEAHLISSEIQGRLPDSLDSTLQQGRSSED